MAPVPSAAFLSSWNFFQLDLRYGQNGLFLFGFVAWIAASLTKQQCNRAAVLSGLICAFKFTGLPFALIFLLRKKWVPLVLLTAVFLVCNLAGLLAVDWQDFTHYYLHVAGKVGSMWSTCVYNISVFALINKFRAPTLTTLDQFVLVADPDPRLGTLLGLGTFILVVLLFVCRVVKEDIRSAAVRACVLCVIGVPNSWVFSESFLLLPLGIFLVRWYRGLRCPWCPLLIGLMSIEGFLGFMGIAMRMTSNLLPENQLVPVPFSWLVMSSMPTLICLTLILLPANAYLLAEKMQPSNRPG